MFDGCIDAAKSADELLLTARHVVEVAEPIAGDLHASEPDSYVIPANNFNRLQQVVKRSLECLSEMEKRRSGECG